MAGPESPPLSQPPFQWGSSPPLILPLAGLWHLLKVSAKMGRILFSKKSSCALVGSAAGALEMVESHSTRRTGKTKSNDGGRLALLTLCLGARTPGTLNAHCSLEPR